MAEYKLLMPKMGESVQEATILNWMKKPGDTIDMDETVLEVATDKVDSDVPSPVSGSMKEILYQEGETVEVGKVLAIIESSDEFEQPDIKIEQKEEQTSEPQEEISIADQSDTKSNVESGTGSENDIQEQIQPVEESVTPVEATQTIEEKRSDSGIVTTDRLGSRYFSPLVLNIAQTEGIPISELEQLQGSGKGGRVTKEDILLYLKNRNEGKLKPLTSKPAAVDPSPIATSVIASRSDEIIEMDRMRKLIAHHMIDSKRTSAHVSSFVEADLTNVVAWRNKHKDAFFQREGFKLTFMPIIVEAIVNAIVEFPMINVSVDGDKIIKKKDINIGIATALPSGNLIVPVIKRADQRNLVGIATEMNDIIVRARNKKLKPDDTQGGTYTISNVGTFGNVFGTPIINQPQVAIMAVGAIVKKPAVVETSQGDMIAIRHKMFLSHTYDHRVVDGMLGGLFVKRVGEYLEGWDINREY